MISPASSLHILLVLLLASSVTSPGHCQTDVSSPASVELYFDKITGIENSGIINGRQYKMGQIGAKTTPFFDQGEAPGMVKYDNGGFHVPLIYDVVKDELVVKHISAQGLAWFIQLDKQRVHEFVIANRLFRRYDRGFHEILFGEGELMFLARRTKTGRIEKGILNYLSEDTYFIVDSGEWSPFRSTSSLLRTLETKEEKKQLKSFIQQKGIKVRKFQKEDLFAIGTYLIELRNKA